MKSSGDLVGMGGEIIGETNDEFTVDVHLGYPSYGEPTPNPEPLIALRGVQKNPQAKYLGKTSLSKGDCIYFIREFIENKHFSFNVIAVSPQDHNYFK